MQASREDAGTSRRRVDDGDTVPGSVFLEPRRRSERALLAVVAEAYDRNEPG
jgi:hypothetical protein